MPCTVSQSCSTAQGSVHSIWQQSQTPPQAMNCGTMQDCNLKGKSVSRLNLTRQGTITELRLTSMLGPRSKANKRVLITNRFAYQRLTDFRPVFMTSCSGWVLGLRAETCIPFFK